MMLQAAAKIVWMNPKPWEVIEEALARKKPPQKPQWLADRLDLSAQVMTNWKKRGVPPARFRSIADALGLTVDQLEGHAPLPWELHASGWPFPGIEQSRFDRLDALQKGEIQHKVREMITEFESALGKSTGYQPAAGRRSNGR